MNGPSVNDEMWLSSENEADIEDNEHRIILAIETLESDEPDYDLLDKDLIEYLNEDDFLDDEYYQATDEQLRVVDASEILAGYGLDEKELAQLTGKSY